MSSSALTGRAAAMARRKELLQGRRQEAAAAPVVKRRKAAPSPEAAVAVKAEKPQAPRARRTVVPVQPAPASLSAREIAKQKRLEQMQGKGGSQANQSSQRQHIRMKKKPEAPLVEPTKQATKEAQSVKVKKKESRKVIKPKAKVQQTGRLQSMAYRMALIKGKVGETAFKSKGSGKTGAKAKISNPDATSRDIAKEVRIEKCTRGKVCATGSSRPTRPARNRRAPQKVGETQTLSGQTVTGTQVGRDEKKMTGLESGVCKAVTGTEYLGAEEFVSHCGETPEPKPVKVTQTQTTRGQVVSASGKVGLSEKMTGNESGACKLVTGTEYLGTEEFSSYCGVKPESGAAKVTQTQTTRGQVVSGSGNVGLHGKVTGVEPGMCSAVTGTEYLPADQLSSFCGVEPRGSAATVSGGAQRSARQGAKVTGGEYAKKPQASGSAPVAGKAVQKVVASKTPKGNVTTGTQVGRLAPVTGGEPGACKLVTGTGYQGVEELETVCGVSPVETPEKVPVSGTLGGQKVTGDRSGASFDITGAEAGACKAVTGTPYTGLEQVEACPVEEKIEIEMRKPEGVPPAVSGVHPGPIGLTGAEKGACKPVTGTHYQGVDEASMLCAPATAASPEESDFPIPMAQQSVAVADPVAPALQPEGKITGDSWDKPSKVTGTSGPWASQRNTSIRGAARQAPMGAVLFNSEVVEDVPVSPITGPAGNASGGAKVTLSGGARA